MGVAGACTSVATPPRTSSCGGETIKEGDKISLWYISANRDEDVFDDPFRFDITRDPNPHIAFGGGGPHFCLGAQLARMEIHVLFEELAERVPAHRGARPARPPALELHRRHQAPAGRASTKPDGTSSGRQRGALLTRRRRRCRPPRGAGPAAARPRPPARGVSRSGRRWPGCPSPRRPRT